MDLRVLSYYLTVAREENITRAAQLLHITQPTLSRQLMQLEEELGVKLFERSSHRIILTDVGILLKRRAQELVSLADKTRLEFAQSREQLAGELTIGSGEMRSIRFLSGLLSSFRQEHPLVHYDIYSGTADQIKEQIENGLLDLGLLLEPVDLTKYEYVRIPVKERWGVLARADSPLARKESVEPKDLCGVPLLTSKRRLVQNELARWFGAYYDSLQIVATYNLVYNATALVRDGLGSALCVERDASYDGLCFLPLSPKLEAGSVLVWKKAQTLSPVTAAFLEHAKNCLDTGQRS